MSVEFPDDSVIEQEQLPTRRQILIQLARRIGLEGAVQSAIDAEEVLDGQKTAILFKEYGWTHSQYTRARLLSEQYLSDLQALDGLHISIHSDSELGNEPLEKKVSANIISLIPRIARQQRPGVETQTKRVKPKRGVWPKPDPGMLAFVDSSLVQSTLWVNSAACGGEDPYIFESSPKHNEPNIITHQNAREAVRICGECIVRQACFTDAIINGETNTIKGGLIPLQLRSLRRTYVKQMDQEKPSA